VQWINNANNQKQGGFSRQQLLKGKHSKNGQLSAKFEVSGFNKLGAGF
jgi:hypothetical protein